MKRKAKRKDFKGTFRHSIQCLIRGKIRRLSFLKLFEAEKRVLSAIVNHAFHHMRDGDVFAPGRDRLAARSGASIRTVARTLEKMRHAGVIVNVAYAKGARNHKTQFKINWIALFDVLGIHMAETWEWCLGAVEHKRGFCENFLRATFSVPLIIKTMARRFCGGLFTGSRLRYGAAGSSATSACGLGGHGLRTGSEGRGRFGVRNDPSYQIPATAITKDELFAVIADNRRRAG